MRLIFDSCYFFFYQHADLTIVISRNSVAYVACLSWPAYDQGRRWTSIYIFFSTLILNWTIMLSELEDILSGKLAVLLMHPFIESRVLFLYLWHSYFDFILLKIHVLVSHTFCSLLPYCSRQWDCCVIEIAGWVSGYVQEATAARASNAEFEL